MAYCIDTDVESEFKNIDFDTTTLVTTADVNGFILQMSSLIDSYVGMRYVVPVTADASALALLKLYCITLVADRIKKILEVKQATNSGANQDVRGAFGTREVMKALNDIRKGDQLLTGATLLTTPGGFSSYTLSNGIEPTFKKNERQW